MENFKIIEDRGCGICYDVFFGTEEECIEWMEMYTMPHPLNEHLRISIDDDDVNGNGEPFDYVMRVDTNC